jgi:hypothetical protein
MMSLMVGLGLVLGAATVTFAADDTKTDKTDKMKAKGKTKPKTKTTTDKAKTDKT